MKGRLFRSTGDESTSEPLRRVQTECATCDETCIAAWQRGDRKTTVTQMSRCTSALPI